MHAAPKVWQTAAAPTALRLLCHFINLKVQHSKQVSCPATLQQIHPKKSVRCVQDMLDDSTFSCEVDAHWHLFPTPGWLKIHFSHCHRTLTLLLMPPLCEAVDAAGTCVWSNVFPALHGTSCLGYIQVWCAVLCWICSCLACWLFTHGCINLMEAEQQVCSSAEMCKHFLLLNHITCGIWHTSAAETFWYYIWVAFKNTILFCIFCLFKAVWLNLIVLQAFSGIGCINNKSL